MHFKGVCINIQDKDYLYKYSANEICLILDVKELGEIQQTYLQKGLNIVDSGI